jgi:fructose-bisphosphate aldolase class I
MVVRSLPTLAQALVASGKGILAADESSGTIAKRLREVGVESTFAQRCAYRELLFTAPGIERWLSGVILYDETIRQRAGDGTAITELLARRGIVPGIKVDLGAHALAGFPGEKVTEGLGGLRGRLEEYRGMGARFAKWRAVLSVGDGLPSDGCIAANAHALARYAALCQEAGLVPIVEPEVLMEGAHELDAHRRATARTLAAVFAQLREQRVALDGILLKCNMVLSGDRCPHQATVDEVAEATLRCLRELVPAAVPGIVFLSGGQSPEIATHHLAAMNQRGPQPWELSFSFGRALQEPVLQAWRGDPARVAEAQRQLIHRARLNGEARSGAYVPTKDAARE